VRPVGLENYEEHDICYEKNQCSMCKCAPPSKEREDPGYNRDGRCYLGCAAALFGINGFRQGVF